jgi:hypothetical protein
MVKPWSNVAERSALDRFRRARQRARRRGVTVFVVVLVLAMLTGLGLFAARSASLATSAAGYERQMTQTHYIAEYAMLATTAELSTGRLDSYINEIKQRSDPTGCLAQANVTNRTCYRFGYTDLEARLPAPAKLLVPYNAMQKTPSSLGQADVDANFIIEMTDFGPGPPVAGMDQSSSGAAKFVYKEVTLTITGEVRPRPANPNLVETSYASSASFESTRAHLLLGPVPDAN